MYNTNNIIIFSKSMGRGRTRIKLGNVDSEVAASHFHQVDPDGIGRRRAVAWERRPLLKVVGRGRLPVPSS